MPRPECKLFSRCADEPSTTEKGRINAPIRLGDNS